MSRRPLVLAAVGVAVLLAAVLLVPRSVEPPPTSVATTAPVATTTPTATSSASPSASPLPAGTFENLVLGYRITMPAGYRLASSRIFTGQDNMGRDSYTLQTEAEARDQCLRDGGDVGSIYRGLTPDVNVGADRNARGLSVFEWAAGSFLSTHHKLEQTTIGGREAVRFVSDNAAATTDGFVIRGNDRIYTLFLNTGPPPKTWLDDIARTFAVLEPVAFPSPTATTTPRVAAQQTADTLAQAFTARDADAVGRITTGCWINVVYAITDGPTPGAGALYRSVALFTQALRERFARGDLTVVVDPTLRVATDRGGQLFVRSEWREPDGTTLIDLEFRDDGKWVTAVHLYTRAQAASGCIRYRSPWGSGTC
jgi:hypothetical protein